MKGKIDIVKVAKQILKRPDNPSFQVLSTIPLIWHIVKFYFFKIVDFVYNNLSSFNTNIKKIQYARKHKKIVAKIHFLMGLDAIRKNHLADAMLRFWLVSRFIKKSETLYYHYAFLYYLKGDINKTVKYLSFIRGSKKNAPRVKYLIEKIVKTNYDIIKSMGLADAFK